jgi:LysM repeat protein
MDTDNKDSMKYKDIDLDMFDIEEEPDAKSEAFTAVSIPPDREKNSRFPRPKMVLIGGVVLLLIAGLVYFLTDYVEKNLISKEDTVIIQYQLGQINEKLEKDAAEKEGVEKVFSSEFSKLSERIDNLEAKINFLNNKDPEQYYKVRRGETLTAIARKHDITVKELCALNNISPKQKIYPGQKLVVHPPLVR